MDMVNNGSGSGAVQCRISCVENRQELDTERGSRPILVLNNSERSKYQRHSPRQIEKLEGFFQRCTLPNKQQRFDLGIEIGMESHRVKYWFQNRRTKMKKQQERRESTVLKDQNAKFFAENIYLWEKLKNPVCPYCGDASVLKEIPVETYELQMENIRLKEELERVSLLKREIRSNNRMFPNFNSSLGCAFNE